MRKIGTPDDMIRRILIGVILALIIGCSVYLFNVYRHAAPPKYFYVFIALAGAFIVAEVYAYRAIRKKCADSPTITKLVDLFASIVFGLLLYLFAVYVYPAK